MVAPSAVAIQWRFTKKQMEEEDANAKEGMEERLLLKNEDLKSGFPPQPRESKDSHSLTESTQLSLQSSLD